MLQDMQIIENPSMYCFERAITSYAKYLGRDYELLFVRMLGFRFNQERADTNDYHLGKCLYSGYKEAVTLGVSEKYLGIRIEAKTYHDDMIIYFKNRIDQGLPIALREVDHCLCSWETIAGEDAFLLLVGYDEKDFICFDVHTGKNIQYHISIENILTNLRNGCKIYDFSLVEYNNKVSFDQILQEIQKTEYLTADTVGEMNTFAEYIGKYLNFQKEEYEFTNMYFMPFFLNILHIFRGRKLIAITFQYFYDITKEERLYFLSHQCEMIGNEWNAIWSMLQKAYFVSKLKDQQSVQKMIDKVVIRIRQLTEKEQSVIDVLAGKECTNRIVYGEAKTTLTDFNPIENFSVVDLKEYYNCKAFSDKNNTYKVDFTGHQEFFVVNESYEFQLEFKKVISFLLGPQMDNISCCGQEIEIEEYVSQVVIIGCAEWDECYEMADFVCENEIIRSPLALSDWYHVEENKDHAVGMWDACIYDKSIAKRSLFYLAYSMGDMKYMRKIILPKNKNLHVFTILLAK